MQGVPTMAKDKVKKRVRCWKRGVDTHAVKDCTVQHYCYICDKIAQPVRIEFVEIGV